jgi:hypothetical protein
MRYHVVQPYARGGDYRASSFVESFDTVDGAFRYLNQIALTLTQNGFRQDALAFVVVDEEYRPVSRPTELTE